MHCCFLHLTIHPGTGCRPFLLNCRYLKEKPRFGLWSASQAKVSNNNEINVLNNGDTLKEKQVYDISRPLSIESISQGNVNIDFMLLDLSREEADHQRNFKETGPGETQ